MEEMQSENANDSSSGFLMTFNVHEILCVFFTTEIKEKEL